MLGCITRIWIQTYIKIFLLTILARLASTNKINAAYFPTVYMPEKFDHTHLNGLSRGLILSQRGLRYSSNLDCTMTLTVRGPFGVLLAFEHIDLARDNYNTDSPCEDYVQFYGGTGKETTLSGQYCGSGSPPAPIYTNSSIVTLRFRTNHYREKSGFRIKFDTIPVGWLSDCDEMGVCRGAVAVDDPAGEVEDESGERKKRSIQGSAANSGGTIGSRSTTQWTLLVTWLSILTTILSVSVRNCYGLQNR